MERIEAALARIDRAAETAPSVMASQTAISAARDSLRIELAGTLQELDALIKSIEQ